MPSHSQELEGGASGGVNVHPLALLTSKEISRATLGVRAAFSTGACGPKAGTGEVRWIEVSLVDPSSAEDRAILLEDPLARALAGKPRLAKVTLLSLCSRFEIMEGGGI